jgi:hypothetical protein
MLSLSLFRVQGVPLLLPGPPCLLGQCREQPLMGDCFSPGPSFLAGPLRHGPPLSSCTRGSLLIGLPRRMTSEKHQNFSHCTYESCTIVWTSSNTIVRTSSNMFEWTLNDLWSISSDIEWSYWLRPQDWTSTRVPTYCTTFFEHYSTSIEQVSNDLLTLNSFIEHLICSS